MLEIERKYLLDAQRMLMDDLWPVEYEDWYINQTYLNSHSSTRRIRYARNFRTGDEYYTLDEKNTISFGTNEEVTTVISPKLYQELWKNNIMPKTRTVVKTRRVFTIGGQKFEIDTFDFGLIMLEVELKDINEKFEIPSFLPVLKEVTGNYAYSNSNIARLS